MCACVVGRGGAEARARGRASAGDGGVGDVVARDISRGGRGGARGSSVVVCARWVRRWWWWCDEDDANGCFFATGVNVMTDAGVDCVFLSS
jgi:hypothetical protein